MKYRFRVFLFIFVISLIAAFQAGCGGTTIEVKGEAMIPTFNPGDKVLIDEETKEYARGDIIVFSDPKNVSRFLILRIVGLPGERIEIRGNKTMINGELIDEPYVQPVHNQFIQSFPETSVPDERYYVMGDNRDSSSDSRYWGTIGKGLIKGKYSSTYSKVK